MFTIERPIPNFESESISCVAGAFGDIIAMMPYFYGEHKRYQRPHKVIVRKTYASIFDGVSYVEPIIYEGDTTELYDFVKKNIQGRVKFLNPPPIEHTMGGSGVKRVTDSFIKEMWRLSGKLDNWGIDSPNFDRRDHEREKALVEKHLKGKKPFILVALDGRTSPFPFSKDLMDSLAARFKTHKIIDLCKIEAERIYDLIGLFDRASLIIASDTAHLHLSAAANTPTIALVQDRPTNWNGSPWHKRFIHFCRYSMYPSRKEELLGAISNCISGVPPIRTRPIQKLNPAAYNPSIIEHDGKLLMAYRWHPVRIAKTNLAMAELDSDFNVVSNGQIEMLGQFNQYSQEDVRLFKRGNDLWTSYVLSKIPSMPAYCVMGYGKLHCESGRWSVMEHYQIKYGKNDWTGLEKNHLYFESEGKLYCIYSSSGEQVVLEIQGEKVVAEHRSPVLPWGFGEIRGGALIPHGEHFLRICHSRTSFDPKPVWWRYHALAVIMESKPPFKMLKISTHPILSGHEWRDHQPPFHYKPNVVFPAGLISRNGELLMSVGVNDCAACISTITEKQLNLV